MRIEKYCSAIQLYVRFCADQLHRETADRDLQREQCEGDQQCDDQRLAERLAQAVVVIGAEALRRDTGRAHAQEIHARVQEAEDGRADRDRAEVDGAVEMAGHARVDHAEQRHRHVRQDHRRGDAPDVAVLRQALGAHDELIRRR